MKNRYLFVALILSITAAYFIVEKGEQKEVFEIQQRRDALNLSRYGKVTKIRIAGEEVDANTAITENLDLFYEELQKLKVDRILKTEEVKEDLLSEEGAEVATFIFSDGHEVSFKVGKKISLAQSFYLSVVDGKETTWMIARFETAFPADAGDKDRYRSNIPYLKFREVLRTPKSFFYTELKK